MAVDALERMWREIEKALEDRSLRVGVRRYTSNYWASMESIKREFPDVEALAEEVRKIREYVVDHLEELVEKAMEAIERAGGKAYLARDAAEARRIVGEIVGTGKLIVKGKSLVAEEIGLYDYLTGLGNEVWETDLGELLARAVEQKPMHMIAPSINMPREVAARVIEKITGERVPPGESVEGLVARVRRFLREKFARADVGVTGANMVAADTGTIVLIENEGNIRLSSGLPPVHVVVTGVEKVYPTLLDAFKAALVAIRYGGYRMARYVNLITGPSATGDIEKVVVKGAHGPRELHVVFIDNGRFDAARDPVLREALMCLRCGACQLACPVFGEVAGYWGGRVYVGGIGVAWTYITEGLEAAGPLSTACLLMGRCREACPLKIDIPGMVREVRRRYVRRLLSAR